jgi:hypothetical protein
MNKRASRYAHCPTFGFRRPYGSSSFGLNTLSVHQRSNMGVKRGHERTRRSLLSHLPWLEQSKNRTSPLRSSLDVFPPRSHSWLMTRDCSFINKQMPGSRSVNSRIVLFLGHGQLVIQRLDLPQLGLNTHVSKIKRDSQHPRSQTLGRMVGRRRCELSSFSRVRPRLSFCASSFAQ